MADLQEVQLAESCFVTYDQEKVLILHRCPACGISSSNAAEIMDPPTGRCLNCGDADIGTVITFGITDIATKPA